MSDKLKQFIDENRHAFDHAEPGYRLFDKIESRIGKDAKKKLFTWPAFHWAAVLTGTILLALAVYTVIPAKKTTDNATAKEPAIESDLMDMGDPAYVRQISQFQEVIELKQEELKQLKNDYPELYSQFVNDITELDRSYENLKTKLPQNPNREMLLEAMIQNLQLQSELLNRQLLIIKEIKQKTKNNAKNTI